MSEVNKDTLVKDLIENKVYIWTTKFEYFPKVTGSFILWNKNWQIIIDPDKIAESLVKVKEKIEAVKSEDQDILVVWDKEVFRDEIEKICTEKGFMFLNNKVPSWIFTNFETFQKRIHSMNNLKKFIESTAFWKLTKKEQLMKKRELSKLETFYKWLTWLKNLPKLVIVIDTEYNIWVVKELEKVGIEYIAVSNTNLSRWLSTDNLIVSNTNSYESMNYLLNYLLK